MSGRHHGKLIVQAIITVGLLGWLAGRLNWQSLSQTLITADPAWFLLASGLYLLSLAVAALRWRSIMRSLEHPIALRELLALNLVGAFFNQVLPGSLSGDTARAFYSGRQAGSLTLATAAVLGDRLLGMGALVALVLTGYVVLGREVAMISHLGTVLAVIALGYFGGLAVLLNVPVDRALSGRLRAAGEKVLQARIALRAVFRRGPDLLRVAALSLVVQVLFIAVFWSVSRSLDLHLDQTAIWVVWPVVSLIAVIPISLAGWGVREGLMAFYLSQLGVDLQRAVVLSVLVGLAVLVASLPGGLVWLWMGSRRRAAIKTGVAD
ncbi:MAG: lysylphosphatidylglycerol synthase transmembrane domain-containing protein [Gammaproteobacteria bacterium]